VLFVTETVISAASVRDAIAKAESQGARQIQSVTPA
jgi:hypothetical protein